MKIHSLRQRLLRHRRFKQMLIGSVVLSVFMSFIIVPLESSAPNATIRSYSDGLWWTVQTLTTVGYGDVTPVTEIGRIIGIFMQVLGTILFGSLLAIISSSMSRNQEEFYWDRLFERFNDMDQKIDNIEKKTKYIIKSDLDDEK
jgi:hypothetical protein